MEKIREKPDPNPKPEVSKNNFERHRQVTVINVSHPVPSFHVHISLSFCKAWLKYLKQNFKTVLALLSSPGSNDSTWTLAFIVACLHPMCDLGIYAGWKLPLHLSRVYPQCPFLHLGAYIIGTYIVYIFLTMKDSLGVTFKFNWRQTEHLKLNFNFKHIHLYW